ncbi:hypothetical protein ACJMK2_029188, partial [Sinanodonta woodiana]
MFFTNTGFGEVSQKASSIALQLTFDSYGTRRPSDSTGNILRKLFVSNKTLAFRSSKGVEVNHVSQQRVENKTEPPFQARMILESNCVYNNPLMPAVPPYASVPNQAEEIPEDASDKVCHGDDVHGTLERKHMVNANLGSEWKKQAKNTDDSKADADCSSYKSISDSDEKQMFPKSQMDSTKTHATKRPSDSTKIKLEKKSASDEKLIFPSSEGVKILSWDKVSYSKIVPAAYALSPLSCPEQNTGNGENKDTHGQKKDNVDQEKKDSLDYVSLFFDIALSDKIGKKSKDRDATRLTPEDTLSTLSDNWINVLPEEIRRKFINRSKSIHSEDSLGHFRLLVEILTTGTSEKIEDKPVENREDTRLMFEQILSMLSNDQDRDATLVTPEEIRSLLLDNLDCLDYVSLLPDIALSDKTGKKSKITVTSASRLYVFPQTLRTGVAEPNTGNGENKDTHGQRKDNVDQEKKDCLDYVSFFPDIALSDKTGKKSKDTGNGENKDTHGQKKDNVDQEKKDCLDYVSFFPDIALSDKTGKKSKDTGNGENKDTHGQKKDNVDQEKKDCLDYVSFFPDIALSDKTGKKSKDTGNGENKDTHGQKKDNVDQEKKDCLDYVSFFPDIALSDKTGKKSKDTGNGENKDTHGQKKDNVDQEKKDCLDYVSFFPDIALSDKTGKKSKDTGNGENKDTHGQKKDNVDQEKKDCLDYVSFFPDIALSDKTGKKSKDTGNGENKDTHGQKKDNVDQEKKDCLDYVSFFPDIALSDKTGKKSKDTGNGENKDTHGQKKDNVDQEKK